MTAADTESRERAAGTPVLVRSLAELRELTTGTPRTGPTVLVPTMGALHDGHADLMDRARDAAGPDGLVVATVFVNPLQFSEAADLDRYPRTLEADLAVCAGHGVDAVLAPAAAEVYPDGEPQVAVHPGRLGELWEGASRPGHFAGVLTVVAKLFGLVRPDAATFGEKDYQQLVLVRRMVSDLALGVDVLATPTRRDPDGLALSSRNRFLDAGDRERALRLPAALRAGAAATPDGPQAVLAAARAALGDLQPDYLALAAPDLGPPPEAGDARLLVAARVGAVRLLDNTPLTLRHPTS